MIHITAFYFLLSRKELTITDTELNAIAPEAIIGFNRPNAATGIAITL
jgi:hypothetical protein